ncbi:MAG: Hsp70 family protein, partial [Paracoccaceae bacterium]
EARNQAESLIHSTKKSITEHGDKVDPSTVEAIELAMGALQETLEKDDADTIKSGIQNLTEAAMRLGEAIYKSSQSDPSSDDDDIRSVDDDIVDADFEDLGNDEHK